MARLGHIGAAEFSRGVRDGRTILLAGPAKSGLTWLSAQLTTPYRVRSVSLRGVTRVDDLREILRNGLSLPVTPERPADVMLHLRVEQDDSSVVLLTECHRCSNEVLDWLLTAALDPVTKGARSPAAFVFEGAIDPDVILERAFPTGLLERPLVQYVEPTSPWRTFAETEDIVRSRRPSYPEALVPWLADASGGDVGLALELLERLPGESAPTDTMLEAACDAVARFGTRSREIRETVTALQDAHLMLLRAVSGRAIAGIHPSVQSPGHIKRAFLAGLLAYDGMAGAYRVRGPLTARLISETLGKGRPYDTRFIQARLLAFFSHIAAFELDLRAEVRAISEDEFRALAAGEKVDKGLAEYRKRIRELVWKLFSPDSTKMGELGDSLKELLPESVALLSELGVPENSQPEAVLEAITFSQLVSMARKVGLIKNEDQALVHEINSFRNAFAHFRAESFDRCRRLLEAMRSARRIVER